MDSKQRDVAIRNIESLRRTKGVGLFDFGSILAMPTRDLQTYLTDSVYRPLERSLNIASRNGFGSVSYVIYSAFDRDKDLISYSFVEGAPIPNGRMPEGIETGINLTREKHIVKPKPVDLMIYVKAIDPDLMLMPEDLFADRLTLV